MGRRQRGAGGKALPRNGSWQRGGGKATTRALAIASRDDTVVEGEAGAATKGYVRVSVLDCEHF